MLALKGHFLIAMPGMEDHRFARSVVLICAHDEEGAMGFVINQPVVSPSFTDILDELGMEEEREHLSKNDKVIAVHRGGPVEQGRGFVIHSLDYGQAGSNRIGDLAAVTATLDALRHISSENPPEHFVMLLGYAGWSGGQLEEEIAQNGWLTLPATRDILFKTDHSKQYEAALAAMGIDEASLSASAGHA